MAAAGRGDSYFKSMIIKYVLTTNQNNIFIVYRQELNIYTDNGLVPAGSL